jgi:hypothetical protein
MKVRPVFLLMATKNDINIWAVADVPDRASREKLRCFVGWKKWLS